MNWYVAMKELSNWNEESISLRYNMSLLNIKRIFGVSSPIKSGVKVFTNLLNFSDVDIISTRHRNGVDTKRWFSVWIFSRWELAVYKWRNPENSRVPGTMGVGVRVERQWRRAAHINIYESRKAAAHKETVAFVESVVCRPIYAYNGPWGYSAHEIHTEQKRSFFYKASDSMLSKSTAKLSIQIILKRMYNICVLRTSWLLVGEAPICC